jgi:hypothetical protein
MDDLREGVESDGKAVAPTSRTPALRRDATRCESRAAPSHLVPGSRLVKRRLGRLLAHGSESAGHVRELSFSDMYASRRAWSRREAGGFRGGAGVARAGPTTRSSARARCVGGQWGARPGREDRGGWSSDRRPDGMRCAVRAPPGGSWCARRGRGSMPVACRRRRGGGGRDRRRALLRVVLIGGGRRLGGRLVGCRAGGRARRARGGGPFRPWAGRAW